MIHDIRLLTFALAASICLALGTAAVSVAQTTPTQSVIESKTLLDTIDLAAWNPRSLVVNPDIQSVAYIQRASNRKVQVVRDGTPGAPFDAIKSGSLIFSEDGKRLAYQATQGNHQVMVVDESVSIGYDKVVDGSFSFSPDGTRYTYAAQKENKWFAVVDGTRSPPYRRIVPYSLQFSSTTNRVAYIAIAGSKQVMVLDGKVSPRYDNIWIGPSLFDPTGTRTAYVAQTGDAWTVVVDGDEGPRVDFVIVSSLMFSKDGQHTAYIAQSKKQWIAVRDGNPGMPYERIRTQSMTFSPQGGHLAYAARNSETWTTIVDGKQVGQAYDDIDGIQPNYSPDGSKLAFGVRMGNQWGVVMDGTLGVPHTDIGHDTFRFSSDNQHFAYTAQLEGSWFMMLDGKPDAFSYGRRAVENLAFTRLGTMGPVFSPDGKRLAYSVLQGIDKLGVVVDGQLGRPHWDLIEESLLFSPDSAKIAYVAGSSDRKWRVFIERKVTGQAYDGVGAGGVMFSADSEHSLFTAQRNGQWVAVVDGQEGEPFNAILAGTHGPLHMDATNELRYIGRQGNKIYLVTTKIGAV